MEFYKELGKTFSEQSLDHSIPLAEITPQAYTMYGHGLVIDKDRCRLVYYGPVPWKIKMSQFIDRALNRRFKQRIRSKL